MLSRAEEAGGSCEIISRPGSGCRVTFRVPSARLHNATLKSLFARRRIVSDCSGPSPAQPIP